MDGLFIAEAFTGFGPAQLQPAAEPLPLHSVTARSTAGLRSRVRQECPRRPGVYGMVDAAGALVYVGKAKCLRTRLLSYFRARGRGDKARHILQAATRIVWEHAPSEFAALLRELELIRRWRPRFNVQGQPRRYRRTYVCLGRRPAPYVFLAPRPPAGALACFGPVPAGERAREAVRRVNGWFGLRDCTQAQAMHFADEGELFPEPRTAGCLRYELGTCLGPCAGACTRTAYRQRVEAARAFLDGTDPAPLTSLQQEMEAAAAAMAFERAGVLRDRLEVLHWLATELTRMREARQHSFVYPVNGHGGCDLWYAIRGGRVVAILPCPRTGATRERAARLIEDLFAGPDAALPPPAAEETDGVLLVAAWFRRRPGEQARTFTPAEALARCRGITPPTVAIAAPAR